MRNRKYFLVTSRDWTSDFNKWEQQKFNYVIGFYSHYCRQFQNGDSEVDKIDILIWNLISIISVSPVNSFQAKLVAVARLNFCCLTRLTSNILFMYLSLQVRQCGVTLQLNGMIIYEAI